MSDSLFLPLQFNGHFSRWTWVSRYQIVSILDFTGVRMMEVVVTTGAIRCGKLQSNCHHEPTNTELFPGRMPFPIKMLRMTSVTCGRDSTQMMNFEEISLEVIADNRK